jgi:hypothetical protein
MELSKKINKTMLVHLFHIIFVGGIFLYIGIKQTKIPKLGFQLFLGLGIFIILYHLYKAYTKISDHKNSWVNLIHILIVGPLVCYIGFYGEKTPRYCFELLLMLAFASIGYHGYYMVHE